MEIDVACPELLKVAFDTYAKMGVSTIGIKVERNKMIMSGPDVSKVSVLNVEAGVTADEKGEIKFPLFSWRKIMNKVKAIDSISVKSGVIEIVRGSERKIRYKMDLSGEDVKISKKWKPKVEIDYAKTMVASEYFINAMNAVKLGKDINISFVYDGSMKIMSKDDAGVFASADVFVSDITSEEKVEVRKVKVNINTLSMFVPLIKVAGIVIFGIPKEVAPLYIEPQFKDADVNIYIAPIVDTSGE